MRCLTRWISLLPTDLNFKNVDEKHRKYARDACPLFEMRKGAFFLSHGIFICGLTEMIAAHAMTPQDIYRQAEHQVFVLEVLDKKGGVVGVGHGGSL